MRQLFFSLSGIAVLFFLSCDSKPKVIEADSPAGQSNTPIFQDAPVAGGGQEAAGQQNTAQHTVKVAEVLNTERYSYLRVTENDQEYWIAIGKRPVDVGKQYVYTGGIMKKNFPSKEFNRVFETVYLVSNFRDEGMAMGQPGGNILPATAALEAPKDVKAAPGAIKIADLVANLKKYEGKTVKITGKCVKFNPMIMGRNWVHLQDGSGKNLDLTVTTNDNVQLGSIVTLQGTLGLSRDFGAGYRYDYIVEGALLVQ